MLPLIVGNWKMNGLSAELGGIEAKLGRRRGKGAKGDGHGRAA